MNPFAEGTEWKGLIQAVAPTLATALGGPLAGAAVVAIGRALGQEHPTQESLAEALATAGPDELLRIKQADHDFAVAMRNADIKLEEVHAQDRDSARKREASTGDSATPRVLAAAVVGGFLMALWAVLTNRVNVSDPLMAGLVGTMIGYASAKADQVVSYYFGSSAGSKAKDETIRRQSEGPQG
jgi:hypothetical protein